MGCLQQSLEKIIRNGIWQKFIANVPPGMNGAVYGGALIIAERTGGSE